MQRSDKQINPLLFELTYTQIKNSSEYFYLNAIFIILQYGLFLCKLYFLIDPTILEYLSLPYTTLFIALIILLGLFIILTFFSYHFELLNSSWIYFLFFLQAIEMVYVEIAFKCFTPDGWCDGDPKYILSAALLLIAFGFVIYIRTHCYCPFNDSSNPLSMNSGKTVFILFIYSIIICIATNSQIIGNPSASKQFTFIVTCTTYAVTVSSPYSNPFLSRIFSICSMGLLWTSALIWFTPIFQDLLNLPTNTSGSFWYCWGYSFPIVLALAFIQTKHLNKAYQWQQLFLQKKIDNLKCLYLQATQLVKFMDIIRKSELKGNSSQFKLLWDLIKFHNNDCQDPQCPLQVLQGLNLQRGDELVEQKRFNKTVQKALQFGLLKLVKQKDIYPNFIELNIEIANYQLQVFHLRTKGLQLYNRQFHKETLSKQEMWGIFYLKRKIEGFQTTGEVRAKGETEEDITSFKHDIQVSVSMLAEFWYFLSDPKCNLKKLYDLANVLFPTKIRVDQTWKIIRQFKNIQCYYLYAKYLIKMFNDKQKGLKILEEAHKLEIQNNQKEQILAGNESNLNEQHGVIFLQFDGKNSGIMYQVNTACQIIFGYNKGELQGRKVNDIMPKVISIHHDRILQNYQQTNRPKMMNKERVIWGKSKDGYLFPFTICIKPVRNYYSQTSEVYASVKRDLWVRQSAFFFTDVDFNLSDISASILGLFPDLHGRLHLKKKVHIDQIVPDFEKIRQKVINQKQSHDLIINRTFAIGDDQQYSQRIQMSLVGQQVSINVSGVIGYYFRLVKNVGSNSYSPNNNSSNFKENNADASNSYWMKRQNDFRFIVSVEDEQLESIKSKPMVYHGGLLKNNSQTLTLIHSRIQNSFQKTKKIMNEEHETAVKVQYGGDIKMKRLMGQVIRQIHQLSQVSQHNNIVGNNDQDQQQNLQMVKPSELSSILSRQKGNKNINFLKIFTIAILLLSTLLSIFQYILTYTNSNSIISTINTISSQNSLSAQIMYINYYSNLYSFGLMNDADVLNLKSQINELDSLLQSIPFSVNTQITYSDGANQSMILSFAIAKLISETQLLTSSSQVAMDNSDLFFVQYNSVNGLTKGCQQAFSTSKSQLLSTNDAVLFTYWIYLAISASAFLFILVLKNILLRAVLKKKGEILNVFFQIPRYACSSIQKQCEKFIQRLTMDQDQEQLQFNNQDEEQQSTKKIGRQKKRTVMGQQKTGSSFIAVSLILFLFLLIYPVLVIISAKSSYQNQQYSFASVTQILKFQKQMAKIMSFINTHQSKDSFPLNMDNATQVITNQYLQLNNLVGNIEEYLYYLGNILSQKYIAQYNNLFFNTLCKQTNNCSTAFGQDKGLNTILFYYFDYVVQKYKAYLTNSSNTPLNSTIIQKQQTLRLLLKQFWRQFGSILTNGASQFIKTNDATLFAFMLVISITNMTFLMWGWIRFYNSLGQKIIATQYILTFIPIDQINKNPKIAKYIKEQVLRAR